LGAICHSCRRTARFSRYLPFMKAMPGNRSGEDLAAFR
jgi:hypothetical protein